MKFTFALEIDSSHVPEMTGNFYDDFTSASSALKEYVLDSVHRIESGYSRGYILQIDSAEAMRDCREHALGRFMWRVDSADRAADIGIPRQNKDDYWVVKY